MGFRVHITACDIAISTKITQDTLQCLQNARSKSDMVDLILTGSALLHFFSLSTEQGFLFQKAFFHQKRYSWVFQKCLIKSELKVKHWMLALCLQ